MDRLQVFAERQDAAGADQAANLHGEGGEGDGVDGSGLVEEADREMGVSSSDGWKTLRLERAG